MAVCECAFDSGSKWFAAIGTASDSARVDTIRVDRLPDEIRASATDMLGDHPPQPEAQCEGKENPGANWRHVVPAWRRC